MKYTAQDIDNVIATEDKNFLEYMQQIDMARRLSSIGHEIAASFNQEPEVLEGLEGLDLKMAKIEECAKQAVVSHAILVDGLNLLREKVTTEQGAVSEEVYKAAYEHDQELIADAKRDLQMDDDVIEAEEEDGPDYAKEPGNLPTGV